MKRNLVKQGYTSNVADRIVAARARKAAGENVDLKDGTAVMLDTEQLLNERDIKRLNPLYVQFVRENGDRVFHVKHQEGKPESLIVGLEEDDSPQKWLFLTTTLIKVREETDGGGE